MRVLSLFDGMSCGQIALNRLSIAVEAYYASEIDKHAMKVTQANYPDTIQLGDVTKWKEWQIDWSSIDLLLAGSPCQGFSFAGKQLAFDDPRSKLFFVFVEIWQHLKKHNPKAKYLLENVRMKKEHELVISRYMGVEPIEINSSLVSAQSRPRLYWTNIANEPYGLFGDMRCTIPQPKDKGIIIADILESNVPEKYFLSEKMMAYFERRTFAKPNVRQQIGKLSTIMPCREGEGGSDMNMNLIIDANGRVSNEKTGTIVSSYAKGVENEYGGRPFVMQVSKATDSGGKQPYQQDRIYDERGILPCLAASSWSPAILSHTRIRRLTPVECERAQTVPDNYTAHVSDTQRYRMLGNGWTIDVICHILSYL